MRLTYSIRSTILDRVLQHAFSEQKIYIKQYENDVAEQIYNFAVSVGLQQKLAELPPGWVVVSDEIHIQTGDSRFHLQLHWHAPVPHDAWFEIDVSKHPDLVKLVEDFVKAREAYENEYDNARQDIRRILHEATQRSMARSRVFLRRAG